MTHWTLEHSVTGYGGAKESGDFDPNANYYAHDDFDSGTSTYYVTIRNRSDGSVAGEISGYNSQYAVRWSPGGNYLAVDDGSAVQVLDVSDPTAPSLHSTLSQAGNTVTDIDWSDDGSFIAYSSLDNNVHVHDNDPANGFPFNTSVSEASADVDSVEFSRDSSWMGFTHSSNGYVYNTADWTLAQGSIGSAADGNVTWNTDDSNYYQGRYNTGSLINDKSYEDEFVTSDWSQSGTDYDYDNQSDTSTNAEHIYGADHQYSGNYLALGGGANDIEIYDTSDGSNHQTLTDAANDVNDARFSTDDSYLVAPSSDGSVYIYGGVTTLEVSGTVTLNGSGVSGAFVVGINDTQGIVEDTDTTASDGSYALQMGEGDVVHIKVQYDDGTDKWNDQSKPFVNVN